MNKQEILEEIEKTIFDGLSCNNCPEIKRCREQQKCKDNIINTLLYSLLDNDNKRIILNLKGVYCK